VCVVVCIVLYIVLDSGVEFAYFAVVMFIHDHSSTNVLILVVLILLVSQ
jgi:hypothetical protein